MADFGILNQYDVGLGVAVKTLPNGFVQVAVDSSPLKPEHDGPLFDGALVRTYLEEIAVGWLEQVAPHRLASGIEPFE